MQPEAIVNRLLENEKFKKWDNAYQSGKRLYALKQQSLNIFKEMVRSLGYERALAQHGIDKKDVAKCLVGAHISATHNYKGKMAAKFCTNQHCDAGSTKRPLKVTIPGQQGQPTCPYCHYDVTSGQTPISPSHLRDKMANFIVGVETKEGKFIFFDEPLRPDPWNEEIPGEWDKENPLKSPKDPLPVEKLADEV